MKNRVEELRKSNKFLSMKGVVKMKKSNLLTGILLTLIGIFFLLMVLFTTSKLDGLLFGLTGACIGPGILMIFKYYYWSSPKNKERYREKINAEKIEQHDELKEKLPTSDLL